MFGSLYLGTSGYSYDGWKHGVFYPEGLKAREMLPYYASRLNSVEINYTFRRFPSEKSLDAWRSETPDGFRFTLKANQRITHFKRLAGAGEEARAFVERAARLGDRLGAILFQCPPSLDYDGALLASFLDELPPGTRAAMEFRHPSWTAARELLRERGVAWCVAQTDDRDPAPEDLSWDPFGSLRLRKTEYADDELRSWAERIDGALTAGQDVYCYFKHEDGGASPRMAKRLEAFVLARRGASAGALPAT